MKLVLISFLIVFVVQSAYNWTEAEDVIQSAINEGYFSGGVLGIATANSTILKKAYGTIGPKYGFYSPPVTVDMKFDLGSLTQPIGINSALMQLIDGGKFSTTTRVSTVYFDFDNNGKRYVTIQNLLQHNSGLQSAYTAAYPKTPQELIKAINNLKLQYTTQTKFQFSDIGSVVLGSMITKVRNQTLPDSFFQILLIAGLRDTVYLPKTQKYKIAPSGYTDKIAWGTPYNKLAHFLNDAAGNAGLFSTVGDMITYMQLMLNEGQIKGYSRVFSQDVVNKFLNVTKYPKYTNTRALGWQTVPLVNPPCGKKFSPSPYSFGMSDVSGSYIWADRKKNVTIVFLANGAYPAIPNLNQAIFQGKLSDAIMTALGY